jgi:hypothetical protein
MPRSKLAGDRDASNTIAATAFQNRSKEIAPFAFKPSAKLHEEPDAGVSKDLLKRELLHHVSEILGVITAPVMPHLPISTRPDVLLRPGADRIITNPGFDSASGLYLAPIGSIIEVPDFPSEKDVKEAVELLAKPWVDFPFASSGDGIDAWTGARCSTRRGSAQHCGRSVFGLFGDGVRTGGPCGGCDRALLLARGKARFRNSTVHRRTGSTKKPPASDRGKNWDSNVQESNDRKRSPDNAQKARLDVSAGGKCHHPEVV